ncbi:MAG: hypothetical protein M1835_003783, partial [Candelina submexicana]
MASKAAAFKEEGNKCFQDGDFKGAEILYTKAIQKDPTNPLLFTNRAFARLRLQSHEGVISDCLKSIEILPQNMKAYNHLAQAQLALHHPNEALASALTAYNICLATNNGSATAISALVLKAKKEKWEKLEKERLRMRNELVVELEERLELASDREMDAIDDRRRRYEINDIELAEERQILEVVTRQKIEELRSVFAIADTELHRREVPEYLIDSISFSIMHDPVMTKTGQSYDRATILEHLKRSQTDP